MAQNMDPRGRPHRSRNPLWSIRLEYFKSNGRILSYWISKMTITRLDKYYVHGHPEVERPLLDKETRPIGEKIPNILVLAFSFLPLLRALQSSQALISRHVAACDIGGTGVYRRRTPDRGSSRGTSRRGYHPGTGNTSLPGPPKRQPWNGCNYRQTKHPPKTACLCSFCSGPWE